MLVNIYASTRSKIGFQNYDSLFVDKYVASSSCDNADYIFENIYTEDNNGILLGVADGCNGIPGSNMLAEKICREASEAAYRYENENRDFQWYVFDIVARNCEEIEALYTEDKLLLGTTLTMLMIHGSKVYVGNIGDSPALLVRNNALQYFYHEDTEAAKIRNITERFSPNYKNADGQSSLTKSINTYSFPSETDFNYDEFSLSPGDKVVIASDALIKAMTDKQIVSTVSKKARKRSNTAIMLAEEAAKKSADDTTVIVIDVLE